MDGCQLYLRLRIEKGSVAQVQAIGQVHALAQTPTDPMALELCNMRKDNVELM